MSSSSGAVHVDCDAEDQRQGEDRQGIHDADDGQDEDSIVVFYLSHTFSIALVQDLKHNLGGGTLSIDLQITSWIA